MKLSSVLFMLVFLASFSSAQSLHRVEVNTSKEVWIFDSLNKVTILGLDIDNNTMLLDAVNLTLENAIYTADTIILSDEMYYEKYFLIPEQNISEVVLNITVEQENRLKSVKVKIPIRKISEKEKLIEDINTGAARIRVFFQNNWALLLSVFLFFLMLYIIFIIIRKIIS